MPPRPLVTIEAITQNRAKASQWRPGSSIDHHGVEYTIPGEMTEEQANSLVEELTRNTAPKATPDERRLVAKKCLEERRKVREKGESPRPLSPPPKHGKAVQMPSGIIAPVPPVPHPEESASCVSAYGDVEHMEIQEEVKALKEKEKDAKMLDRTPRSPQSRNVRQRGSQEESDGLWDNYRPTSLQETASASGDAAHMINDPSSHDLDVISALKGKTGELMENVPLGQPPSYRFLGREFYSLHDTMRP